MKKTAGIISLIGCCAAILFCLVRMHFAYSSYTHEVDDYTEQLGLREAKIVAYNKYGFSEIGTWEQFSDALSKADGLENIHSKYLSDKMTLDQFRDEIETPIIIQEVEDYISEYFESDKEEVYRIIFLCLLLIIPLSSLGIYYTIATRFGSMEPAILRQLENESNIIRKQIEKRRLLVKLENLEKK